VLSKKPFKKCKLVHDAYSKIFLNSKMSPEAFQKSFFWDFPQKPPGFFEMII
jgi:hypothetical protein